uniref:Si:ch73-127m5.3 n=1 Tax=Astyanax mexicanus TaxID=7994 RepID=A0A3B1JXU1_ASTMX
MQVLLVLVLMLSLGAAQKSRVQSSEWDYKAEVEKVSSRGCANLTLVLDNWKYAIVTQVKDLLLNDYNTVLPDYGRIQPLSEALGDLYKEFNGLKERLVELSGKFQSVESFVDDVRAGRNPSARENRLAEGGTEPEPPIRRRTRVVLRKVKKILNPHVEKQPSV